MNDLSLNLVFDQELNYLRMLKKASPLIRISNLEFASPLEWYKVNENEFIQIMKELQP